MKGRFTGALLLAAAGLALSWTVSFAGASTEEGTIIESVPAEARPSMTVYRGGIGAVGPGDLFLVDARDAPSDLSASLHLANAGELFGTYRYLIFRIGVWRFDENGTRQRLTVPGGEDPLETLLTLTNGGVSFVLPGGAGYAVVVNGGSWAAFPAGPGGTAAAPDFFLTLD